MTISIVKDSVYKHISGTLDVNVRTYSVLTNSHTYKVSAQNKMESISRLSKFQHAPLY